MKILPCAYSSSSGSVLMGELMLTAGTLLLHGALAYIVSGFLVRKKKITRQELRSALVLAPLYTSLDEISGYLEKAKCDRTDLYQLTSSP